MESTTLAPEIQTANKHHNPEHILKIGMGFWASKTVLAAVNFDLFTLLGKESLSGESIRQSLGLHKRSYLDFLDALVALGFLTRTGIGENSIYSNSDDADLEEGLKTGLPQNELKQSTDGTNNLSSQVKAVEGDFFKDTLPSTDVITMGKISIA